jgi:hypothetical protein
MSERTPGEREDAEADAVVAGDEGHIATSVARAVAAVRGTAPTDLPPVHDVVDVDALDRLVRSDGSRGGGAVRSVSFEFAGCHVVVDGRREVRVRVRDGEAE